MSLDPEVRRGGNLPFAMIANRWMCDPRYSANARTLYAILVSYADTQSRDTGFGKPYRSELARQLGVSVSTLDRTLDEMEVAGLVTVERRAASDRPRAHDANVYHLHDAGLMWQSGTPWVDPLPTDAVAADVAKAHIEQRRHAKREAGIVRKGGVAKGINTRARKPPPGDSDRSTTAGSTSFSASAGHGGGSTGAVTPLSGARDAALAPGSAGAAGDSSTDAAEVAAPVLPFIENPVQSPSPEAPSARSAADARRASHLSVGPGRESGGAASGTDLPTKNLRRRPPLLSPQQAQVLAAFPRELLVALEQAAGTSAPQTLVAAVENQLAERSAEQLAARVARRWHTHGYAARHAAGTLVRPVGVAIALVRAGKCGHARCDDGLNVDHGTDCTACTERRAALRSNRNRGRRNSAPVTADSGERNPTASARSGQRTACPACGLPDTGGTCIACRNRRPTATDALHGENQRPGPPTSTRPRCLGALRCTNCRLRTGRSHWGGWCGTCHASNTAPTPAAHELAAGPHL